MYGSNATHHIHKIRLHWSQLHSHTGLYVSHMHGTKCLHINWRSNFASKFWKTCCISKLFPLLFSLWSASFSPTNRPVQGEKITKFKTPKTWVAHKFWCNFINLASCETKKTRIVLVLVMQIHVNLLMTLSKYFRLCLKNFLESVPRTFRLCPKNFQTLSEDTVRRIFKLCPKNF